MVQNDERSIQNDKTQDIQNDETKDIQNDENEDIQNDKTKNIFTTVFHRKPSARYLFSFKVILYFFFQYIPLFKKNYYHC